MSYIDFFLPGSAQQALIKRNVVVVEKDWQFLDSIFPEPGFRSYFVGFIISKLAKELKNNGTTTYHKRSERPELADISRFLSNLIVVRNTDNPDERAGTGAVHSADAKCTGNSASAAFFTGWETEEGKVTQERIQARLESLGLKIEFIKDS